MGLYGGPKDGPWSDDPRGEPPPANKVPGADGDFSVAYWCTQCPATFRDAASSNAHHDATGHNQTWRPSQSYGERLGRRLCEHCGNPLSKHPIRVETKSYGVLTCSGDPQPREVTP